MLNDYAFRTKDNESPELNPKSDDLLDDPDSIIDNVRSIYIGSVSKDSDFSILDLRIELPLNYTKSLASKMNSILDPGAILPYEYSRLRHLRETVYESGQSLVRGRWIENLEKIGFHAIKEHDRLFLIADHRIAVPTAIDRLVFHRAVQCLMEFIQEEMLDYSYMWSLDYKGITAAVKMNGKFETKYQSIFVPTEN